MIEEGQEKYKYWWHFLSFKLSIIVYECKMKFKIVGKIAWVKLYIALNILNPRLKNRIYLVNNYLLRNWCNIQYNFGSLWEF